MTHEQVWSGEIASLRAQAARRTGYVVCSSTAYMAVIDGGPAYRGALRLDKLNGTNHAAGLSPNGKHVARVCRTLDVVLTFNEPDAKALAADMAWAAGFEDGPWVACTFAEMVERRAAAIVVEQDLRGTR